LKPRPLQARPAAMAERRTHAIGGLTDGTDYPGA
jgi:hypothetical protein